MTPSNLRRVYRSVFIDNARLETSVKIIESRIRSLLQDGEAFPDLRYRVVDHNEHDTDRNPAAELVAYVVISTTPKGVWISNNLKDKFILDGHSRFAYKTPEKAMDNYVRRKLAQQAILSQQLHDVRLRLRRYSKHGSLAKTHPLPPAEDPEHFTLPSDLEDED